MKFKMSPNSLFAILLRSPWWVSFALVGLFSLAAAALLPREYVYAGVLGTFPFFAVGCVAAWRQWRAPSAARVAAMHAQLQTWHWRDYADALERKHEMQPFKSFRLGGDLLLTDASGKSRISTGDYAVAMLNEAEQPMHTGQRFSIAY